MQNNKNKPGYLFESTNEAKRLKIKTNKTELKDDFNKVGLGQLKQNCIIVDAGAGVGVSSVVMSDMLNELKIGHKIILLDKSRDRLNASKNSLKNSKMGKYEYKECELDNVPIKSNSVDFIFCRFVFEYLSNPQAVYNELHRILKSGGKMVIGDLDMNCMNIYPLPKKIENLLSNIGTVLYKNNLFDINVGRKLYSYFYNSKMKKIAVHAGSHNVFYGKISENDIYNWRAKIDQFIYIQDKYKIDFGSDIKEYKKELYELMSEPSRFSYTPFIIVEGIK